MAIATSTAIGLGIAAVSAGVGVAGAVDKGKKQEATTSTKSDVSTVDAGTATDAETQAGSAIGSNFQTLQDFTNLGPGANDVTEGVGASRDLAALLRQYQESGGAPSAQDQSQAGSFASSIFASRRLGAQQAGIEANQEYAKAAAIQGRGGLDPIFRNKVAQQQQQNEQMIGADQAAFTANTANQFSQNRLGFANQRANVLGGLATQALSNRQALVGMGSQIQSAERNFRLATATRTGTGQGSGTSVGSSGSSLGNGIAGGLAGFGAGLGAVKGFNDFMNPATPAAAPAASGGSPNLGVLPQAPAGGNIFGVST